MVQILVCYNRIHLVHNVKRWKNPDELRRTKGSFTGSRNCQLQTEAKRSNITHPETPSPNLRCPSCFRSSTGKYFVDYFSHPPHYEGLGKTRSPVQTNRHEHRDAESLIHGRFKWTKLFFFFFFIVNAVQILKPFGICLFQAF